MFDKHQIISPIGAATTTALPKTKSVLSKIEWIIILPICGFLNGGSSRINDEGNPLRTVLERIFDVRSVIAIDNIINPVKNIVDIKEDDVKNIDINVIKIGNLPLHGTKLFVKIAINLSLVESIILVPITPHALHPNPIHIVKDCFPWAQDLLNNLSILNASLGKNPKSSSKVNNGKNIAIGGSITEITQERVLYIP